MKKMWVRSGFLGAFVSIFLMVALHVSAAPVARDYQKLGKDFMTELVDVAKMSKDQQGEKSAESIAKVKSVSAKIDFTALAKKSLGARWAKYPVNDRTSFLATLQQLLEDVVYPKAKNISVKAEDLQYEVVKAKAGQVKVNAEVEREKKGEMVTEKLEIVLVFDTKSGKLVDAVLEDELVSGNLKRQFDEALKKKTFQQIIEQMKKRVDEAKNKKA